MVIIRDHFLGSLCRQQAQWRDFSGFHWLHAGQSLRRCTLRGPRQAQMKVPTVMAMRKPNAATRAMPVESNGWVGPFGKLVVMQDAKTAAGNPHNSKAPSTPLNTVNRWDEPIFTIRAPQLEQWTLFSGFGAWHFGQVININVPAHLSR